MMSSVKDDFVKGETITIPVQGMSCNHCRKSVEDGLSRLPGVKNVRVDLPGGSVTFVLGDETDLAMVKDTIKKLGFRA